MKKIISNFSILLLFIISTFAFAQKSNDTGFYKEVKNYDISKILLTDKIIAVDLENTKAVVAKPEIIGFIGNDYQRFYIHFTDIAKNPKNEYEYFLSGKTKVKEITRPFKGILTITEASIVKNSNFPNYQQGYVICDLNIFEDKKQSSTGSIKGKLKINFVIDEKKTFRYDALTFYSDNFSNNQFIGKWTSYKTKISKKCNWGDFRIPESGDLDIGAGEFSPDSKYFNNGWKYYILAQFGETEIDVDIGKKNENLKWWK